ESDENEFFDFKENKLHPQSDNVVVNIDRIEKKIEIKLLNYLDDSRQHLNMLDDYKIIKNIFKRFNTNLPSSAPVERRYHDRCPIPPKRYVCLKYGLNEFGGMVDDVHHQLLQIRYNMENVTMKILGDLLQLEVPGLAEKRPSVVMGDMIEIRVHEDYRAYTGVIKSVNDKTVDIGYVHEELLSYIRQNPIIEMDVRFVLSRLPLERMHQGVDQIVSNGNLPSLFPDYNLTRENVPMTRTIRDTEQNINQHVIDYTNYEEDGMFMKVTPEELMQYRIVVTTLILVGRYSRKYHPDVVFIDEAAQACEPEVD
ncbi:hypothetical protein NQ314_017937, partial [Rhamnusium bicolor]